jgi:hypothetical protein
VTLASATVTTVALRLAACSPSWAAGPSSTEECGPEPAQSGSPGTGGNLPGWACSGA